MEVSKKPWPILSVCGKKKDIDTNPDFQRPAVWSRPQKQLLIDTILRGYDVPKFYWRKTGTEPDTYDVVDGQQRLRTICECHSGEFPLAKDCDDVNGVPIAKLKYSDLPDDLRLQFDTYGLDVIVLSDTDEDEVREMFLRLQNGTTQVRWRLRKRSGRSSIVFELLIQRFPLHVRPSREPNDCD